MQPKWTILAVGLLVVAAPRILAQSPEGPRLTAFSGEPVPAPKEVVAPKAPAPITLEPAPTANVPVTPETGCCGCASCGKGNCGGGHRSVLAWLLYRPIQSGCCNKTICVGCCPPPLYVYFLDNCAAASAGPSVGGPVCHHCAPETCKSCLH